MPAVLSDAALELLEDLPPFLAGSFDAQAVIDALARELGRLEAAAEVLRANFFPQQGGDYLAVWESLLGLSINPPDKTVEQRRNTILSYLRSLKAGGTGLEWEAQMTGLIGTGWSYEEHDPADPGSPPAHTLLITLPFPRELNVPGQPTLVAAAGGTLTAGTKHYQVTATNTYGETTPSTDAAIVVSANQQVTLDWPDVPGATSYRVYRGTTATNQVLIASGVVASTYVDTGTGANGAGPTMINTSRSAQTYEAEIFARKITPAHIALTYEYGTGFIVGDSSIGDDVL